MAEINGVDSSVLDGQQSQVDNMYFTENEFAGHLGNISQDLASLDGKRRRRGRQRFKKLMKNRKQGRGKDVSIRQHETKGMSSKALFERRTRLMPTEVRKSLNTGSLVGYDFTVFAIKNARSLTEMFKASDNEEKGIGNLNAGKLPNGAVMTIDRIILLAGVGADETVKSGKTVEFKKIAKHIANGTFNFKNGQKIFAENSSSAIFQHDGTNELQIGELKLGNPVVIDPTKQIIFELDVVDDFDPKLFIRVELRGMITVQG